VSKGELENLLNHLVPFAQQMLAKHGEFYPYGGVLTPLDEMELVGADDGRGQPPSEELITTLLAAFRERASSGKCKATALIADVRALPSSEDEETNAIRVSLEHVSGLAIDVFLPYEVGDDGQIRYGELFARQGERIIFLIAED
jgi:hypothetical protein